MGRKNHNYCSSHCAVQCNPCENYNCSVQHLTEIFKWKNHNYCGYICAVDCNPEIQPMNHVKPEHLKKWKKNYADWLVNPPEKYWESSSKPTEPEDTKTPEVVETDNPVKPQPSKAKAMKARVPSN